MGTGIENNLDQFQGRVTKVDDREGTDPITKFLQGIIPGAKPQTGVQPDASAKPQEQQRVEAQPPLKGPIPLPPERPYNLDSPPHPAKARPEARPDARAETRPGASDAVKAPAPAKDKVPARAGDAAVAIQELNGFVGFPADKLSPVQQEAQKMARDFLAEKDKKGALGKYESRAREIMNHSDQAFFEKEKTQTPIIKAAESNYIIKNSLLAHSIEEIHDGMKALPKPLQDKINKALTAIDDNGDNPVSRTQLKTLLKDNPDLLEKISEGINNRTEFTKADKQLTEAINPLARTAHDEADTRFLFQRMARIAGNKGKADEYGEEGAYMVEHYNKIVNKPRPEEILDVRKA